MMAERVRQGPSPEALEPSSPYRHSPPLPLTTFVGRETEIDTISRLLTSGETRLLTLSGPGGVGKTRLSLRVAANVASAFSAGTLFVDLSPVRDPALVMQAIAVAIGIREAGGRTIDQLVITNLRDRHVLLVLDNFEQIIEAAPALETLLDAAPKVSVIVTSREALRVSSEHEYPVLPLAMTSNESGAGRLGPAVQLFVDRANAVSPLPLNSSKDAEQIIEICTMLDGLPLAIELAAARLRHLPLSDLKVRLHQRLPLLTGGARDQPSRLQTMRDAIGWSYDLLDDKEQRVFRSLAIFNGGWTLDAATEVCQLPDDITTLDLLSSLVDKSLIHVQRPDSAEVRYRMLETIREFGLEQAEALGERQHLQERHAEWCLALAEQARPHFVGRVGQEPWLARIDAEHDNLRQTLRWFLQTGQTDKVHQLTSAIYWIWYVQGKLTEGRAWLNQTLGLPWPEERFTEHRGWTLIGAGLISHFQGEEETASRLIRAAMDHSQRAGFTRGKALTKLILGIIDEDRGRYAEAISRFGEALPLFQEINDQANLALTLYHLGIATWGDAEAEKAIAICQEALALQTEIGDHWGRANTLNVIGLFLSQAGQPDSALAMVQESLRERRRQGAPVDIVENLATIASIATILGQHETAATLFGAEANIRDQIGSWRRLPERRIYEAASTRSRLVIGDARYREAFTSGREMATHDVVALALDVAPPSQPVVRNAPASGLTSREVEILQLLATGQSNAEIAEHLFLSSGTVRNHVSSILSKLGARSRTEAVATARQLGMLSD